MKGKIKALFQRLLEKLGLKEKSFVNYISQGNSLPSPLAPDEEAETVRKFLAGDEEARLSLIEHNLRLVVYIAKRFDNTGVDMDDLVSIGTIGLIKAVGSYNPDKNIKLATFASRCIENEILMHLRKTGKQRAEVSLDELLNVDWEGNMLLLCDIIGTDADAVYNKVEASDEKQILKDTFDKLPQRERQILELRFGLYGKDEMTQKEIADMMGISQSYISRLEKKIVDNLKKDMLKLG